MTEEPRDPKRTPILASTTFVGIFIAAVLARLMVDRYTGSERSPTSIVIASLIVAYGTTWLMRKMPLNRGQGDRSG